MSDDGYFDNPFFTREELRCKGSGMLRLHPGFLDVLLRLRREFGSPMIIRSGCRSAAHNRTVGGASDSMHVCDLPERGCLAVDVAVRDAAHAYRLSVVAKDLAPWSIGVSTRGFLHLDARWLIGRPPVLFGYG